MAFNRMVSLDGNARSRQFAEFLGVETTSELDLTEMQALLYARLYQVGAVRNLDGTRAHRRSARTRNAEKQRRARAKEARRARAQTRRNTRARGARRARRGVARQA